MDHQAIANAAYSAGFRGEGLVDAVAIALAESGGDPNAHNTNGEDSRGLWQINVVPAANPQFASWNLYDPVTCAQAAYAISGGSSFGAWTTYTGGAYLSHLDEARGLASNANGAPIPSTSSNAAPSALPGIPATVSVGNYAIPTWGIVAGLVVAAVVVS